MALERAASKAQTALDALMDQVFRDVPDDDRAPQVAIYEAEAEAALAALTLLRSGRTA